MLKYKHKQDKQKKSMPRTPKNKRRYSKRTTAIWFLVILVLALIAVIVYLLLLQPRDVKQSKQNTEVQSEQIQPEKNSDPNEPKPKTEEKEDLEAGKTHQTPKQYEGTDTAPASTLTGFITFLGKNGSNLTVRITINQLLKETGTCTLQFVSTSGQKVERTVPTVDNPSSATCQGFDIPLSEIPAGDYQINIDIKTAHQNGNIKGSITI